MPLLFLNFENEHEACVCSLRVSIVPLLCVQITKKCKTSLSAVAPAMTDNNITCQSMVVNAQISKKSHPTDLNSAEDRKEHLCLKPM